MRHRMALRLASLLAALHIALPVEARPANQQWAFVNSKGADVWQPAAGDLCYVETGKGKAKRRTAYIVDFDGQRRAPSSAPHHARKPRNHRLGEMFNDRINSRGRGFACRANQFVKSEIASSPPAKNIPLPFFGIS